jgi:PAS domain-containing protein
MASEQRRGALRARASNGQVVRMLIREITELIDSTSDSAFAADGSGQVVAWNHAAEAMFGMSATDALARGAVRSYRAWMGADRCARRTA